MGDFLWARYPVFDDQHTSARQIHSHSRTPPLSLSPPSITPLSLSLFALALSSFSYSPLSCSLLSHSPLSHTPLWLSPPSLSPPRSHSSLTTLSHAPLAFTPISPPFGTLSLEKLPLVARLPLPIRMARRSQQYRCVLIVACIYAGTIQLRASVPALASMTSSPFV